LSWDLRNQQIATERAGICQAEKARFPIQDIRLLDERSEFFGEFDVAISLENIEHVIDDRKLMKDLYRVLKPGGFLLLTTPNHYYKAMSPSEDGPFSREEDGWHVRRGYSAAMLAELCAEAGFMIEEISSCSGFFSQRVTTLQRAIRPASLGWALTLPLRVLPPLFDRFVRRLTRWPDYSICMVAYKPRFAET
jgi:SAM-dependent methyltransferase